MPSTQLLDTVIFLSITERVPAVNYVDVFINDVAKKHHFLGTKKSHWMPQSGTAHQNEEIMYKTSPLHKIRLAGPSLYRYDRLNDFDISCTLASMGQASAERPGMGY